MGGVHFKKSKVFAVLLAGVLAAGCLTPAMAADQAAVQAYADEEEIDYYTEIEDAAEYMQTQLLARAETIVIYYATTDATEEEWLDAIESIYTQAADGIHIGNTEYEASYTGEYLTSDSGETTYYLTIVYSVSYDEEELSEDLTYYESESEASAYLLSRLNEGEEEIVIGLATAESDSSVWEETIKSIYDTAAKSLSDDVAGSTSYTVEYKSIVRTDETGVTTYYLEITYSVVYDGETNADGDFTYYESTEAAASYMAAKLLSGETTIEVGLATTESDSAVWESYIDLIYSAAAANLTLGDTTYTAVYSGYYETSDSGEIIYYLTFTYTINYAVTAEVDDDDDDDDEDWDDDDSVSLKNQTIKVKTKTTKKTFKVKKLASKKCSFKVKATGKGKITFKKTGGSSCLKINKKGKVTVKKGTAKGNYMISVKVKAAGNASYKAATKTIIINVKVK